MAKRITRNRCARRSRRCSSSSDTAEAARGELARVFSRSTVDRLRSETGYNPRQRRATAFRLLLCVVEAFLAGQTLGFASIRAFFVRRFGTIRPRAFQLRFKQAEAVAFFRAALGELVESVVAAAPIELDGPLAAFTDVRVYDGTGQRVPKRGRAALPACTSGLAGAKWLIGYSVKTGCLEEASCGAETASELPMWRRMGGLLRPGVLHLFDLAFFDRNLFVEALRTGAHLLLRLKTSARPTVVGHLVAGRFVPLPPWALSTYLAKVSRARGTVFDLDVIWGRRPSALALRLVGVSQGATSRVRWYLTTVPREVLTAPQVIEAYRLRWLIELLFRELKQNADIGRSQTADPYALQALTYGAMIGHVLVRSVRIVAAIQSGIPLEQLRPLAILALVRAFARDLVDAFAAGGRSAWSRTFPRIAEAIASFAHELKPSRSRPRVALTLGAVGG